MFQVLMNVWYEPEGGYHCSVDRNVAIVNLVGFVSLSVEDRLTC